MNRLREILKNIVKYTLSIPFASAIFFLYACDNNDTNVISDSHDSEKKYPAQVLQEVNSLANTYFKDPSSPAKKSWIDIQLKSFDAINSIVPDIPIQTFDSIKSNAVAKNNPFNTLKLLYALGYATKKAIEERHSEALKEKYGIATGGAASLFGNNRYLTDISSMFVTPQMQRNISNSTVINNSPSYNQNITMNTQQPADDAKREFERMFGYTRQALSPGY